MRPSAGGSAVGPPPRKQSFTETNNNATSSNTPTTFFMASERMLDSTQTPIASISESNFGVRSFGEDHVAEADSEREEANSSRRRSTIKQTKPITREASMDSLGLGSFAGSGDSSPTRLQQKLSTTEPISHPLTPLSFASPSLDLSEPSSPKSMSLRSFQHSDDDFLDDRSSQAVVSDSEDEGILDPMPQDSVTTPQFIMPSIMMPSRRPFTARGQELGKLKVLLAGASGMPSIS
jgi:hypothetical protein